MTHDGTALDRHLAALHEHADAHREEVRDAGRAAAVDLEAQRAAIEDTGEHGHDEPPTTA